MKKKMEGEKSWWPSQTHSLIKYLLEIPTSRSLNSLPSILLENSAPTSMHQEEPGPQDLRKELVIDGHRTHWKYWHASLAPFIEFSMKESPKCDQEENCHLHGCGLMKGCSSSCIDGLDFFNGDKAKEKSTYATKRAICRGILISRGSRR